jgi:hypothetical protein
MKANHMTAVRKLVRNAGYNPYDTHGIMASAWAVLAKRGWIR